MNELVQIRGNRQLLAGTHPAASSLKRARELEGEERIPARRLPDAQERRSGKDNADARSQQLVERADAERAELDRQEPRLRHSPAQPERRLVAGGQDCGDRLCLEAGQSEPEHRQRRCVEPLDVVDREQEPVARRRASARCSGRRMRQRPPRRVDLRIPRARARPRAPAAAAAAAAATRRRTTPPIRSANPTNENAASASAGRQESTRYPRASAASTAASHSVVLPIPASPTTTAARGQLSGRLEEIEERCELLLPARRGAERRLPRVSTVILRRSAASPTSSRASARRVSPRTNGP